MMVVAQLSSVVSDTLFEHAWRATQSDLRKQALRLARGDHDRAEEWVSCTAIKALQAFRRAPEKIRNPEGYLFLILKHVYLDSCRHHARQTRLFDHNATEEIDRHANTESVLWRIECQQQLRQLIDELSGLSSHQQRLFELVFLKEKSYSEIATLLRINVPLVRKRVQLLRARLARLLDQTA